MKNMILALMLFTFFTPLTSHASPSTEWNEAETEHYFVVYDAKQKELAEVYALKAEIAYLTLKPYFPHLPEKIVLVINDSTDNANGFATPFPRPMIQVFPVHPSPFDSINYYGDWEYELLIHELGHIAQLTAVSGLWKPLRFLFGSIVTPMALTPRWYLEGMSVDIESRFSKYGRLNSPYYGATVRAFVREGKWGKETLGSMNEQSLPTWPQGQRPYFYGGILLNEIANDQGFEKIETLNTATARRFPGFYSGGIKNSLGKSYQYFLQKAYLTWRDRAQADLKKIRSYPQKASKTFESEERTTIHSPKMSPNGLKLAYIKSTQHNDVQIIVRARTSPKKSFRKSKEKVITSSDTIRGFDWIGNSRLVIDKTSTHDRYYTFSDFHVANLDSGKTKRITTGKRLRYPTTALNKKFFAAVQIDGGRTRLVKISRDGKSIKTLYKPKRGIRLTHPVFISQSELVVTGKTESGKERLYSFNTSTQKIKILEGTPKESRLPTRVRGGLLFQSTVHGAGNLYYWDQESRLSRAVTNTETLILNGTWDNQRDRLLLSELSDEGYQLLEMNSGLRSLETPNLNTTRSSHPIVKNPQGPASKADAQSISTLADKSTYWGSSYLLPQYWFPLLSLISSVDGDLYLFSGATTGGSDPVGHHAYSLAGGYSTLVNQPSGFASYTNNQTPLSIFVSGSDSKTFLYGTSRFQHNTDGLLGSSFYIWKLSNNFRGLLAWSFSQSQVDDVGIVIQQGPTASLTYSSAEQKGYQISPESGGSFYSQYTKYLKSENSLEYELIRAGGSIYYSGLLPKRHSIFLRTDNSFTPRNRSIFLSTFIGGGEFGGLAEYIPTHLVRGYPPGEFIGWRMNSLNFEYRFPISYSTGSMGTAPLFIKRWHAAVTFDTLQLEGGYYSFKYNDALIEADKNSFFSSAGAEVRADTTLFYGLPVTFRMGLHYGFESDAYGGLYSFFGVGTIN